MDTFAAMALSSLPADKGVLYDEPRRQDSHIIDRMMLCRIVGVGVLFFFILTGLWQLLWHVNVDSVSELFTWDSVKVFFTEYARMDKIKTHLSGKELGIFFSIFVMLQFWNMFNAKAYMSGTSALSGIFRSHTFLFVVALILVGQWFIVTYGGTMFSVVPLSAKTWAKIIVGTSLVLVVPELLRTLAKVLRWLCRKFS
jgi:Ca2+-transporting ATPase